MSNSLPTISTVGAGRVSYRYGNGPVLGVVRIGLRNGVACYLQADREDASTTSRNAWSAIGPVADYAGHAEAADAYARACQGKARADGLATLAPAPEPAPLADDVAPVAADPIRIRSENCGAILRAFQGDRCLATATMRRPYATGPLWTLARSDGSPAGTCEAAFNIRLDLRRVAHAYRLDLEAEAAAARMAALPPVPGVLAPVRPVSPAEAAHRATMGALDAFGPDAGPVLCPDAVQDAPAPRFRPVYNPAGTGGYEIVDETGASPGGAWHWFGSLHFADKACAALNAGGACPTLAEMCEPAPRRNSASYCDGKAREFTAVLLHAPDDTAPRWAAVGGQTCGDPLDCVALTVEEAHAAGQAWARKRTVRIGTDLSRLYRVVPLPAGWSNDGTPTPAPESVRSGWTLANTLTDAESANLEAGLAEQAAANLDTGPAYVPAEARPWFVECRTLAGDVVRRHGPFAYGSAELADAYHAEECATLGHNRMRRHDDESCQRVFRFAAPAPAPVDMVAQPVQQAQANARPVILPGEWIALCQRREHLTFTRRVNAPTEQLAREAVERSENCIVTRMTLVRQPREWAPAMVPQPCQQQQGKAGAGRYVVTREKGVGRGMWDLQIARETGGGYITLMTGRIGESVATKAEHAAMVRGLNASADMLSALHVAENALSATLAARGYQHGSCADDWAENVRGEVAALASVRAAIAKSDPAPRMVAQPVQQQQARDTRRAAPGVVSKPDR